MAQQLQTGQQLSQQQSAHAQSQNQSASPLLRVVSLGASALDNSLNHDREWPELGDLLSQGTSAEYSWQDSAAWKPFFRSEVVNIPDAIFEQYNSTECFTQMGLFGDIQRAWITVDNRLYLWNYANGQDFQAYEDHAHTITCVKLVRPKPGVFVEAITHILVIATLHEIFLLGVAAPKGNAGELQFYGTKMSVPATGIDVSCIETTSTGRIFFAGKTDTHMYELLYQAEEGWFSRRCSKVNHTGSALDNFLPAALATRSDEKIIQVVIDDSRKVMYSLSSKSTIRAYSFNDATSLTLNVTYTYTSAASHAQMVNAASPLLDPRSTSLVSISAITTSESKQMYLMATTSTGCRMYMRSSSSSFYNPHSGAMSSLQVSHVRLPPAAPQHTNNMANNSQSNSIVNGKQTQQAQSQILANTVEAKNFAPALFFAVKRGSGSEPGNMLFATAPELNKIALQFSNGNTRPILSETCCWVPIEGFVQDICRIDMPGHSLDGIGSELTSQFTASAATFAVLTNTGVHLVKRRRTVEVFALALRLSPTTIGGVEGEMRRFFENIGRAEGCATCLGVICGALDGSDADSEAVKIFNSSYGSKLSATEIQDTSRKYFIEFGGKAFLDENQNRSFSKDGTVSAPTIEMVRLSGRHDGISLYVARLVVAFWKAPIVRAISGAPTRKVDYVANLGASHLTKVQSRLVSLQTFLDSNKNFIEGLNGPDRLLSATNRTEEIVLQAEHRGMHALVTLIAQIIEGLSFIQVLSDSPDRKMTDLILSLPPQLQQEATQISFEHMIVSDRGREIAKELITTIVNRRISQGSSVESVSETLQKRCGTFCSADDVILYKAIEKLKRAKESSNIGERNAILEECLQLFKHAASTLSMENLKETMDEFTSMQFYSGALSLAFSVARACDPYNNAVAYLSEGKPENDPRIPLYSKREKCYQFIFEVLENLEQIYVAQQSAYAETANASPMFHIRDQTYQVVTDSHDELFHNLFYDWYQSRGLRERLLEVQSPFIQPYLERKATESLELADLLWQYHARRAAYFEAAQVLYDLSRSNFNLSLEARMEYLTQAKNSCACVPVRNQTAQVSALQQVIAEELDVAGIQDDLLNEIKVDSRINDQKEEELAKKLDGKLVPLTELFNKYADPLSYGVICLEIFQAAEYRGALEIRNCWEKLLMTEHEKAQANDAANPLDSLALLVSTLGRRFSTYENVFPVDDLLPMLEKYNVETQNKAPRGWAIDALLEAGVPHDSLFVILDEMCELPNWQDKTATLVLAGEMLHLGNLWLDASLRPSSTRGYCEFRKEMVLATLTRHVGMLQRMQRSGSTEVRVELENLQKRIKNIY